MCEEEFTIAHVRAVLLKQQQQEQEEREQEQALVVEQEAGASGASGASGGGAGGGSGGGVPTAVELAFAPLAEAGPESGSQGGAQAEAGSGIEDLAEDKSGSAACGHFHSELHSPDLYSAIFQVCGDRWLSW